LRRLFRRGRVFYFDNPFNGRPQYYCYNDKVPVGWGCAVDDETAKQIYDFLIAPGSWSKEEYPPPPWHWPAGVGMPEKLENLTTGKRICIAPASSPAADRMRKMASPSRRGAMGAESPLSIIDRVAGYQGNSSPDKSRIEI
jgi:hypothetical protein